MAPVCGRRRVLGSDFLRHLEARSLFSKAIIQYDLTKSIV